MCGIWGIVTRSKAGFFEYDLGTVYNMAIAGAVRGSDSLGIMQVDNDGRWSYIKKAGNPYELLSLEDWKKALESSKKSGKVIVGHNRYATRGSVTDENAHPFHHGKITLVHNGTISHGLKYDDGIEVDSEQLCIDIDRVGIKAALENVYGAWALVWHDYKENTLNILRNRERPLYYLQGQNSFIFGSELKMLEWIADRNKLFNQTDQVLKGQYEENVHYKIDLDKYNWNNHNVADFVTKEKIERSTTYYGGTSYYQGSTAYTSTKPKFNSMIKFKLTKKVYENSANEVKYYGYTQFNEDVVVTTSKHKEIPMGKYLAGRFTGVSYISSKEHLMIKAKSIVDWEEYEPLTDTEPAVHRTLSGNIWTRDRFDTHMQTQKACSNCSADIVYEDLPNCLEYADTLICPACSHEIKDEISSVA